MKKHNGDYNDKILETLKWFCKSFRNYRDYSVDWYVVEKVFNRGMGSADLLRVNPWTKEIWVAKNMARKSDYNRIVDLGLVLGAKTGDYSWKIKDVETKMPNMKILF